MVLDLIAIRKKVFGFEFNEPALIMLVSANGYRVVQSDVSLASQASNCSRILEAFSGHDVLPAVACFRTLSLWRIAFGPI